MWSLCVKSESFLWIARSVPCVKPKGCSAFPGVVVVSNWKVARVGSYVKLKDGTEWLGVVLMANPEARGRIHWGDPNDNPEKWPLTCRADYQFATNGGDPRRVSSTVGVPSTNSLYVSFLTQCLLHHYGKQMITCLSHPVLFTDRSKAALLLWMNYTFFIIFVSCLFLLLCLVCSLQPCDHLLWKGWPLVSLVFYVFLFSALTLSFMNILARLHPLWITIVNFHDWTKKLLIRSTRVGSF